MKPGVAVSKAGEAQRRLGRAREGTVGIRMSLKGVAPVSSPGQRTGEETEKDKGRAQGTSGHRRRKPREGNSAPAGFSRPPWSCHCRTWSQ